MKGLNKACHICASHVVGSIVEKEMRQFSFERTEFACGAKLESYFSANGNVGRAILTDCGAGE